MSGSKRSTERRCEAQRRIAAGLRKLITAGKTVVVLGNGRTPSEVRIPRGTSTAFSMPVPPLASPAG
jgi:hypothetical protein